ncbi:MAG: ABC transporter permease, partial [Aeromicrobium sp.]
MKNQRLLRLALAIGAPILALFTAFLITSLVLALAGDSVSGVWGQILSVPDARGFTNIINSATVYYLSGVAVAIGFRMNLFNIGVDGQY